MTEDINFNPGEYRRNCANYAEKMRVIGIGRPELALFFGVSSSTLERWAEVHRDFDWALQTEPTALGVTSEDFALYNWLKDYRRGLLDI